MSVKSILAHISFSTKNATAKVIKIQIIRYVALLTRDRVLVSADMNIYYCPRPFYTFGAGDIKTSWGRGI